MALYEQFWDCPACGTKNISALRQLKCPNCSHPKTDQEKTYHTGKQITDAKGIALARGARHWACDHCGAKNLGEAIYCGSCGNERNEDDETFKVRELGTSLPMRPRDEASVGSRESVVKPFYSRQTTGWPTSESLSNGYHRESFRKRFATTRTVAHYRGYEVSERQLTIGIGAVVVLALVVLGWAIFHTTTVSARVTGFFWTREVVIQEYRTVHESGWSSPSGAYNVSSSRRIRRYDPIYENRTKTERVSRTCYRDLGTGASESYDCSYNTTTTERVKVGDRPVYDTWYEYDIDKWVYDRTERSSGRDRNPYWPEYVLAREGGVELGAEKVSQRPQTYTVYFIEDDVKEPETYSLNVSQAEWTRYVEGSVYPLEINAFGGIRNNPLEDKEELQE